jgi:hypothetical protein
MTTNDETKPAKREFLAKPKFNKPRAGLKDFRIIVRNLPFTASIKF